MVFSVQNGAFSAPVPGQSLTQPQGASLYEQPPQFVQLDDALNFIWDKLHKPKSFTKLIGMLKAGAPVEVVARTLLYQGLLKNQWNTDLALLMLQTVIWQIEAIAKLKKIKVKTFVDDISHQNSILSLGNMLETDKQEAEAAPEVASENPNAFKGFF